MPVRRPRVLVTRAPHQASALADHLRELGAKPILIPTIETVEPTSFTELDEVLNRLTNFHWLIFTSANAVEASKRRFQALMGTDFSPEGTTQPQVAAIGPSTALALEAIGLRPDLIPSKAVAESLTEALLPHALQADGSPTRFLLIRAEEAREHLPETLRAAGADITIAAAYRTVIPAGAADCIRELLSAGTLDAVTLTSASTVRNLFTLLEAAGSTLPESVVRASIGPITSATLVELGFPPHVESPEATVQSLAETLVTYLLKGPRS